ncbi:hypothetical protein K9U41_22930, partial [Xanthobacter autotrophicus]|nr:hypothetical protein [Xanthobacter autotrophicus]
APIPAAPAAQAAPAQQPVSPAPAQQQPAPAAPTQAVAPQPVPMPQPAPFPQAIERREAPPVGFGVPTASGAAGTATPAESQSGPSHQDAREGARATPEAAATERRPPVARQPPPRRTERAQPEPPPRVFAPLPPETSLPPTRGFGDLPRPPGLVGAQ